MGIFRKRTKKVETTTNDTNTVVLNGVKYKFDASLVKGLYLFEKEYQCPIHDIPETLESQCKYLWCILRASNTDYTTGFDAFMEELSLTDVQTLIPPTEKK
jgi:hypothetical protein